MGQSELLGLGVGAVIGGLYAWLQLRALRRHELRQQQDGRSPSVAGMVPGSMTRVALLLMTLVLVQVGNQKYGWGIHLIWLTFSLGIAYSIPFFWRLWLMYSKRK